MIPDRVSINSLSILPSPLMALRLNAHCLPDSGTKVKSFHHVKVERVRIKKMITTIVITIIIKTM